MQVVRRCAALACIFLLLAPGAGFAADTPATAAPAAAVATAPNGTLISTEGNFLDRITHPYSRAVVPAANLRSTDRLQSLMRAGNLYLSLADALSAALENNLEIEIQRYLPRIAEANILRTRSGGFAPTMSTTIFAGAASVGGATPSSGLQTYLVTPTTNTGIVPANMDPTLVGAGGWAHTTAPQSNTVTTGTSALVQRTDTSSVSVQKYLESGTQVSMGLTNSTVFTNSLRSSFSPATNSSLALSVTQHLLQGFGASVNGRQIRIARNNREVSDLMFKAQVIAIISAVSNLYWDLVSFNENVRVKRGALAASERLLQNNQTQVQVGTLAPITVVQAEAEIAANTQALTIAETQLLQQETILKNAISRTGVADPVFGGARIIPTDSIMVPDVEAISPIQDAMSLAEGSRPEIAEFRIMIQNQHTAIQGTRNELLPTLDLVGTLQNNALAGTVNPLFTSGGVPDVYMGGYGTALSQILSRHYPTYSIGFNLNIPLKNRTAQADYINSQLTLRQQELGLQRLQNQVRVEVQNAVIGLQQARAQFGAASKQRVLQEQTLDAEQKKLDIGVSTTYNVILAQRDLVTAQSNEVAARSAYAKARVEMNRTTGQSLYNNNISLDEAFQGKVARPPAAIPDVPPAPTPVTAPRQ